MSIATPADGVPSIQFHDAQAMSRTIYFAAIPISLMLAVLGQDLFGAYVAIGALGASATVFSLLRRQILCAISFGPERGLEISTLSNKYTFASDQLRSSSVYGFAPAFGIVIFIRARRRRAPVVAFAGAMSTSAGGYGETLARIREVLTTARQGDVL